MSHILEMMPNLLVGIIVGICMGALISMIRNLLDRIHITKNISINGINYDLDSKKLDSVKNFFIAQMTKPQVFIAHSFKDSEHARKLADILRERGIKVWLAEEQLRPGDNIQNCIRLALISSGYFVAMLSSSSLSSKWVMKEFQMAISRERQDEWPRVIPVIIEQVEPPEEIRGKLCVDLTRDYVNGVNSIVSTINAIPIESWLQSGTPIREAKLKRIKKERKGVL